jgi:signal transduction histidine kinase
MSQEVGVASDAGVVTSAVRLLVVDDDHTICRQLAGDLAHSGFQVVTAHAVDDAIAQVQVTPADVAIVDLGLSGPHGGIELIRHLKRDDRAAVHVIVLTGRDDEHSRIEAFEAGSDDYCVKPIGLAEIRRRVHAAARTRQALVSVRLDKEAAERRLVYGQEATALLAHDLNNGLSVSLANLSYLMDVVHGDADTTDALAATLRSVRRMSGLVANFVDIARFEDAAVKPNVQRARVRPVLESVIDVNAPSITHGVQFEVDCAHDLEGRFDHQLVERVLHNLFGNASRYCEVGGTITFAARRWHASDEGSLEICLSNTGPQVPENIRPHLFGKYVQGKGGKRGMGLYFCRLVAEAHSGRIEYEARPTGPCFVLRLSGRD